MALLCVYAISTILPCNEIMQCGSRVLFAIYVPHMQPINTVHVHVVAQSSVGRLTALYEHLSLRLALKSICWSIKISPKCQVIFKCHKGMQYKSSNWKQPSLDLVTGPALVSTCVSTTQAQMSVKLPTRSIKVFTHSLQIC